MYNKKLDNWSFFIYVGGAIKCCSGWFTRDVSNAGIRTAEWIFTKGKFQYGDTASDAIYEVCMIPV